MITAFSLFYPQINRLRTRNDVSNLSLLIPLQPFGPRSVERLREFEYSPLDNLKPGSAVILSQYIIDKLQRKRRDPQPLSLTLVPHRIDSDHDFKQRIICTNAPQV